MNKILVVEDDETIRECIVDFLRGSDYLVDSAEDGAIALASIRKSRPDLLILDLSLPKVTGETVCREARNTYPDLPIIILTAKNQRSDMLNGFQLGADDYISKPFEFDELIARIKAKLRKNEQTVIQVDDLILNTSSVSVTRTGKEVQLSPHEFKLLQYLMSNKGKVLSREMILSRVWEYSYDVDSRVVDVYIGYLRK